MKLNYRDFMEILLVRRVQENSRGKCLTFQRCIIYDLIAVMGTFTYFINIFPKHFENLNAQKFPITFLIYIMFYFKEKY